MELINATNMVAGYTMGMDPDGRESIVVVVKGTFLIPNREDDLPRLADEQVPLVMADEFTGKPGFSATIYETDFAPFKPRCDVLLNGSAYAPRGIPAARVPVELKVGTLSKSFDVVGNRVWKHGMLGTAATRPEPFAVMPISYDNAFGGMDESHEDPKHHSAYQTNHVGRGYHGRPDHESIDGQSLPNTEEINREVSDPNGKYRPMSFGPIARSWPPRLKFSGTYDDDWMENVFPFLPGDFDSQYFQCAPPDQQIIHPMGGDQVVLSNLTPRGRTEFRLPTIDLPIEFTDASYKPAAQQAVIDTIMFEPDLNRFTLAWRVSHPLKRNMLEMRQCVIGRMPRAWYRARYRGKNYYPSLGALVVARQSGEEY